MTGAATGSYFADFLLGIPHSSSIAFGNPDKLLGGWALDSYVNDDWRLSPSLTLNLGVRWEYEAPLTETSASRFVVAGTPIVVDFLPAGGAPPRELRVTGAGPQPEVLGRLEPFTPSRDDLRAYVGE